MKSFQIQEHDPLSSNYIWDKKTSVASRTIKDLLYKKQFQDDIVQTKNPYLLQRKLETYYKIEFREICSIILKDVYYELKNNGIITWDSSKTFIFKNVSQFATILGVDSYDFGWNLTGMVLQPEKMANIEISAFVPVVEYLVEYFQKNFHLQPYYNLSLREIFHKIKPQPLSKDFDLKKWKYYFIYQHELRYPNTFLFYIQNSFANYIKFWEDDKIFRIIYSSICKYLELPLIEIPDRVRNNILYCYHHQKLPISITNRYTLQHFENLRMTNNEIQKLLQYKPNFSINENTCVVKETDPLHPDYRQTFQIRKLQFDSIMQYFLFKLYLFYVPPSEAYKNCKHIPSQIDEMIQRKFKTIFFKELMNTMNNTIDARIELLKIKESHIVAKESEFNFLGKNLMDLKNEMKSYINQKYPIETEMVIYALQRWLDFWNNIDESLELNYIEFFFDLFFPFAKRTTKTDYDLEDVLFPIVFKNEENTMVVYQYIQNWSGYEKQIQESHIMNMIEKYSSMVNQDYLLMHFQNFLLLIQKIKVMFGFFSNDLLSSFEKSKKSFWIHFIVYRIMTTIQKS